MSEPELSGLQMMQQNMAAMESGEDTLPNKASSNVAPSLWGAFGHLRDRIFLDHGTFSKAC